MFSVTLEISEQTPGSESIYHSFVYGLGYMSGWVYS